MYHSSRLNGHGAYKALLELEECGLLTIRTTLPITYMIDGKGLRLPFAKKLNHPYKNPHWIPVAFCRPEREGVEK